MDGGGGSDETLCEHSTLRFESIFSEFSGQLLGYLFGMTQDRSEAEDLTQETFLKIQRGLDTFRGESSVSTWVYRIATNVSRDHFKRRSTREREHTISTDQDDSFRTRLVDLSAVSPERAAAQAEMSSCVQRYVLKLSPTYRAALVLHDMQGLRNPEVAEILEIPVSTVKMRVHRARSQLKEALDSGCDFEHDERNVLVCEPAEKDDDSAVD